MPSHSMSKCLSLLLIASNESPISAFAPALATPKATMIDTGLPQSRPKRPSRKNTTHLHVQKDNDRARMEKTFDGMMGDNWREFRARLVMQEAKEMAVASAEKQSTGGSATNSGKEEKVGNFFAGAISSIFKGGDSKDGSSQQDSSSSSVTEKSSNGNIFNGDTVGRAELKGHDFGSCSDPFLTEEECHIMYDEPDVKINKHRWAHPLFHVEPGSILVANEKLGGVFHQTVVLIIDHNDAVGSTGMVINR